MQTHANYNCAFLKYHFYFAGGGWGGVGGATMETQLQSVSSVEARHSVFERRLKVQGASVLSRLTIRPRGIRVLMMREPETGTMRIKEAAS